MSFGVPWPIPRPNQAPPGHGKERLSDLVALVVNYAPGILPGLYSDLHVPEYQESQIGSHTSGAGPGQQISVFSGGKENQEYIGGEKNQALPRSLEATRIRM